jgi:hypothetical protein
VQHEPSSRTHAVSGCHDKIWYNISNIITLPHTIFLYELSQLADTDADRSRTLPTPLAPVEHYKPGLRWDAAVQAERDAYKIDICEDEYVLVRGHLMVLARRNSLWLREVFLRSPEVHVSSRDHVMRLLERWMIDPCDTNRRK